MEIKCPRCQMMIPLEERAAVFPCPSCGSPLEIVTGEAGFTIIGVNQEAKKKASLDPREDPLLQYYSKWQEAAAFTLAAAVGCAFILFIDIRSSYLRYGHYFWKNPDNLIFIYIGVPLFLLFLLGGGSVFLLAARRKKTYLKKLEDKNLT